MKECLKYIRNKQNPRSRLRLILDKNDNILSYDVENVLDKYFYSVCGKKQADLFTLYSDNEIFSIPPVTREDVKQELLNFYIFKSAGLDILHPGV